MDNKKQLNELEVYESIDKQLKMPRNEIVFPLSPTHRKELRDLKSKNIGNLNHRLDTIKQLKMEEFRLKHRHLGSKEFEKANEVCRRLNDDWARIVESINMLINKRKEFEEHNVSTKLGFEVNCDWNDIAGLKTSDEFKRRWSVQEKYFFKEKIDELFDEKYGQSFNEVSEIIDDISTKYEEAINFGDLELVKKLYYIMKSSEQLFKKIDKLVI